MDKSPYYSNIELLLKSGNPVSISRILQILEKNNFKPNECFAFLNDFDPLLVDSMAGSKDSFKQANPSENDLKTEKCTRIAGFLHSISDQIPDHILNAVTTLLLPYVVSTD